MRGTTIAMADERENSTGDAPAAGANPEVRALAGVTIACADPVAMADLLVTAVGWQLREHGALNTIQAALAAMGTPRT